MTLALVIGAVFAMGLICGVQLGHDQADEQPPATPLRGDTATLDPGVPA